MTRAKLPADQERVLLIQSALARLRGFYLAGGTGLALRLRHRISADIDWFTAEKFSAPELLTDLGSLSEVPTQVDVQDEHTVRAYYGTLETSFIRYAQVSPQPEMLQVSGHSVPVADLQLAAAMKAGAIYQRGTKRDFVDVHAMIEMPGWSMSRFIEVATQKLPLSAAELTRALCYFDDAEREPMPRGCAVEWSTVKREIAEGVRAWQRERSKGRGR